MGWPGRHLRQPDSKLWLDRMAEKGWTAPTWPREYGGGGLSNAEARVLAEEMAAQKCRPPLLSFGLSMLGPVLLEFAKEEQKQEHLPKIVRGEIRWCQGYSEPGAGSDLAGLQTRADDKGDHYLVNGQKIWTSMGGRIRLDLLSGADGSRRPKTRWDQLPAVRHEVRGGVRRAHQADQRLVSLLSDLLRGRKRFPKAISSGR